MLINAFVRHHELGQISLQMLDDLLDSMFPMETSLFCLCSLDHQSAWLLWFIVTRVQPVPYLEAPALLPPRLPFSSPRIFLVFIHTIVSLWPLPLLSYTFIYSIYLILLRCEGTANSEGSRFTFLSWFRYGLQDHRVVITLWVILSYAESIVAQVAKDKEGR